MPATFPFLFTMQLLSGSLHCSTVGGRGREGGKKGVTPGVSLDTQLCAPLTRLPFSQKPFFSPPPPSFGGGCGGFISEKWKFFLGKTKEEKEEGASHYHQKNFSPHTWVSRIFDQKRKAKVLLFLFEVGRGVSPGWEYWNPWVPKNGDPKERKLSLESRKKGKKGSWQEISDVILWVPNRRHHASSFPESNKSKQGRVRWGEMANSLSLSFLWAPR